MMNADIILLALSFFFGLAGALAIIRYGKYVGVLDIPNERSSHTNVIPKGGGVGILVAFVASSVLLGFEKTFWVCGFVLAMVSFMGDRLEIRPIVRLFVQFGCASIFLMGQMYLPGSIAASYFWFVPLCVFIAGTANFYNFMDGINGIAGITGVICFLLLAVYGNIAGFDSDQNILPLVIAFSCAGFLPFNFPKAKVFMGDVGSILLGFVFACTVILFARSFLDFICMASFLFPFYADELTTMLVRIRDGEKLTQAHRKHVYQLLANEYGIEHWKVTLSYGVVQLLIGSVVMIMKRFGSVSVLSFLFACFLCFVLFSNNIRMKLIEKDNI